ncbi:S8 family serine peptidase [Halomarina oriensis]|uniref:S8 family serine peptidase n=1 Tax=Halomarina oriensis TaxID=671145 RepID=A0A6B0GLL0_9EURY|nr:S8 family serine peptidase [Halomarina oriensis]MWG34349.1 S8 family serine peptidase [Halomarina oriensis]
MSRDTGRDDTHRDGSDRTASRRSVLAAAGALGASVALPYTSGRASAGLGDLVDDTLDTASDALQETLVVFESNADVGLLDRLSLTDGFLALDVLPVGYALLTGPQIEEVAGWEAVRYVEANRELDYHNADAREVTGVSGVRNDLGYDGSSVHTAVIDSGVAGSHPDLDHAVENNYRWVGNPLGEPTLWVPVGGLDSDDIGHGTHCSGTIAGDGTRSDGEDAGMAPGASLTVYSSGAAVSILKAAAAFDHLLANHADEVSVVSNSYGAASADDYNPDGALQTATWETFDAGLLPVFSAGNSGPGNDTLNDYAKAPHVLSVAATDDQRAVTDFSSRGRAASTGANYDRETALDNLRAYYDSGSASGPVGLYRNGVGAPGNQVTSTMSPLDVLNVQGGDTDLYYATISGTSMSCPVVSGTATLLIDAAQQEGHGTPAPIDVLNTLEATAYEAVDGHNPANIGAGFIDAEAAVQRAANGNVAGFGDVTLTQP